MGFGGSIKAQQKITEMLRASVILPAYNNISTIERLLNSLRNQSMSLDEFEIIAVDGGSTDGTREYLESINFEGSFKLIKQEKNLGIGSARNRGINAAKSKILLFIDCDMEVEKEWVETHTVPIEDDRWDGAVGNVRHGAKVRTKFIQYLDRPRRGAKGYKKKQQLDHSHFQYWNTSIRKELLTQVGGFDEKIEFWGGEELELMVRVENRGKVNLQYNADAKAIHHQDRNLEKTCDLLENFGAKVVPYLVEKHPFLADEFRTRYLENLPSRKALMISLFNPIFFRMVRTVYKFMPGVLAFPAIKYILGYSVFRGYISYLKQSVK